jgi:hypothetical protein
MKGSHADPAYWLVSATSADTAVAAIAAAAVLKCCHMFVQGLRTVGAGLSASAFWAVMQSRPTD